LRATIGSEAISRMANLVQKLLYVRLLRRYAPRNDNNSFMQLNIKATNLELAPNLKDYVQKKMDALDKYLGKLRVVSAYFEVSRTTKHHLKGEIYSAEANLSLGSDLLRVEKTEKDVYKAVDKVRDHLELVIKKYKDKKNRPEKEKS